MSITMKFQDRSLRKILRAGDKPARRAAVDAINLAVRSQMKHVYRRSASELGVAQRIIRKRTYNSKASMRRPAYVVRTVTWGVNLAAIKAKKSPRVRGLKKGAKIIAPGAFLGTRPNGQPAAYRRRGPNRFPLEWVTLEIHDIVSKNLRSMNRRALSLAMRRHYKKQLKYRQQQARR